MLVELLVTASDLANAHARIGFLRAEEIREPKSYAKQERMEEEAYRAICEEKRWLLIRLLDERTHHAS